MFTIIFVVTIYDKNEVCFVVIKFNSPSLKTHTFLPFNTLIMIRLFINFIILSGNVGNLIKNSDTNDATSSLLQS